LESSNALRALASPLSAIISNLGFRADTSAISDITNKPFNKINPNNMTISIWGVKVI
jgi:hypothetical protein